MTTSASAVDGLVLNFSSECSAGSYTRWGDIYIPQPCKHGSVRPHRYDATTNACPGITKMTAGPNLDFSQVGEPDATSMTVYPVQISNTIGSTLKIQIDNLYENAYVLPGLDYKVTWTCPDNLAVSVLRLDMLLTSTKGSGSIVISTYESKYGLKFVEGSVSERLPKTLTADEHSGNCSHNWVDAGACTRHGRILTFSVAHTGSGASGSTDVWFCEECGAARSTDGNEDTISHKNIQKCSKCGSYKRFKHPSNSTSIVEYAVCSCGFSDDSITHYYNTEWGYFGTNPTFTIYPFALCYKNISKPTYTMSRGTNIKDYYALPGTKITVSVPGVTASSKIKVYHNTDESQMSSNLYSFSIVAGTELQNTVYFVQDKLAQTLAVPSSFSSVYNSSKFNLGVTVS